MAFNLVKTEEHIFESWADLDLYLAAETSRYTMVPIEGFLETKARFTEDRFWGDPETKYQFNRVGFAGLCRALGIPAPVFDTIQSVGLATNLLNDRLNQPKLHSRLKERQLVIDKKSNTIAGVVSTGYLGYSNATFLEHLREQLSSKMKKFSFAESYMVNTNLYLRIISDTIRVGIIAGSGGNDVDESQVGLEFRNSMVGEHSVSASIFIHRLACANGLVVSANTSTARVNHAGKPESMEKRIATRIKPAFGKLATTAKQIEYLGGLTFDPQKLVKAKGTKKIYSIIDPSRHQVEDRKKLRGAQLSDFDERIIAAIPQKYGGELTHQVFNSHWRNNASMFDFINVFTEYAKEQSIQRKLEIEEKSGNLASWIYDNRKKFL